MSFLTTGRVAALTAALLAGACAGESGKTVTDADKPWAVDPRNITSADDLIERADAAFSAGEYFPAADFFQRAQFLYRMEKRKDDEALMGLGRSMMAIGGYAEAAEAFRAVVAMKDRYHDARVGLGYALLALGQPLAAKDHFAVAIQVQPTARTYNGMGVAHDMVKDHESAQHFYRAGLEIDPEDHHLRHNLGLSLALKGEFEMAIRVLGDLLDGPEGGRHGKMSLALAQALSGDVRAAGTTAPFDIDYRAGRARIEQARNLRALRAAWVEDGIVRGMPERTQLARAEFPAMPEQPTPGTENDSGAEVARADTPESDPAGAPQAGNDVVSDGTLAEPLLPPLAALEAPMPPAPKGVPSALFPDGAPTAGASAAPARPSAPPEALAPIPEAELPPAPIPRQSAMKQDPALTSEAQAAAQSAPTDRPVLAPFGQATAPRTRTAATAPETPGTPQPPAQVLEPYRLPRQAVTTTPLTPAAPAETRRPKPEPAPGGTSLSDSGTRFQVQMGSFRERVRVDRRWEQLQKSAPELLSGIVPMVEEARIGTAQNRFFRLRTSPFASRARAQSFCDRLAARAVPCIVVRMRQGSRT